MAEYLGINIDYERDRDIPEQGLVMLTKKGFYKRDWENSPQESFARAATCYSFGDYALAQRIYDYVSKGHFTFASPVLSNAIDIIWPRDLPFDLASDWLEENKAEEVDGMPISCFEAGTPIITISGEMNIEDIQVGTQVLTHKGRFRKVLATKKSVSSDIYRLRCSGNSTPMNVTGNHRMLTNLGWVKVSDLDNSKHMLACNRELDFDTSESIVFKIHNDVTPKYNSGTFKRSALPREVELTTELAWAIGFWFAEGSTSDNGTISVVNQDESLIRRWMEAFKVFGVNPSFDDPEGRNWLNGRVHSKNLQEFFDSYFGKGCKVKCIPDDLMKMNEDLFTEFFNGLYAGDGFKTTSFKAIELSNTKLISQISLLLNKYGVKHRYQLRKRSVSEGKFNGIINIPTENDMHPISKSKGFDMYNGLTYYSIKELTKLEDRTSTVYDIQVEEDESFSVAGVVAHNCFLNAVSDTKESLVRNSTETRWLSMNGGGVGTYFGNRAPDEKSTGVMAHIGGYDADTIAYRQTSCYLGDTEVLTNEGWKKFSDVDRSEKVAMINDDGSYEFVYPEEWLTSDYEGKIYNFSNKHKGFDLHVTANHNMVVERKRSKGWTGELELVRADSLTPSDDTRFISLVEDDLVGSLSVNEVDINSYDYSGKVYCCTVPSGKILVKSGDIPLVCGNSRRGSIAAYLDIDHPEILKFLETRNPVGGDQNNKNFNINNAVNVTDAFMHAVINGDTYELVDPKHGNTGIHLSAREVWEKICDMRFETGEPYVNFIDTVNRNIPKWIKNPLYKVVQSNLCSEICLMSNERRTAVCCLSSLNVEKYDEWKDTTIVADLTRFLDNVLEYFIRLAPEELSRAVYSARKERAIGIGTLGVHAYFQSKMIPFESGGFNSAVQHTAIIYKDIKAKAVAESLVLGKERGESSDCRGSGMRNSHLLAIAPNASSSSLVNTSPSAEPWAANAFSAGGRAGAFLIKNKYLEKLLESKGYNTPEVWKDIVVHDGSVQHLDFLNEFEKKVFKTSFEIDQMWIIELASVRQPELCQSQSVNTFLPPGTLKQTMSDLMMAAYIKNVKSLYYCRSDAPVKAKVSRPKKVILANPSDCLACEG